MEDFVGSRIPTSNIEMSEVNNEIKIKDEENILKPQEYLAHLSKPNPGLTSHRI
jgi:hypothetical protein